MKESVICLLLSLLVTIIAPLSFAQQNQTTQKPNSDVESLKDRILELESKLQTVENVEKIELAAKLAEAQAKLRNAEFSKFKNELRESNNEWLKSWSLWFLTIIGIFAAILIGVSYVFWFWLRSRADLLIADSVERSLTGFKEAMTQVDTLQNQLTEASDQVDTLQNQIRILEKEHAASVLENFGYSYIGDEDSRSEQIRSLREEILLQLFVDETRWVVIRDNAAEVLAARKSTKLVSPALRFLNSVVDSGLDSDIGSETAIDTEHYLNRLVSFVGVIYTEEAYQGLTKFLERLLTEEPQHKDLFLMETVLSLARVSVELKMKSSVPLLKSAMSHFKHPSQAALKALAVYFDRLDAPTGVEEILTKYLTSGMPDAENTCVELLQKHAPDFVKQWQAQKANANTESDDN